MVKVSKDMQVKVSEDVAKALNLKEGSEVSWRLEGGKAVLTTGQEISREEEVVLKKLNSITFADRTKENVRGTLEPEEFRVLGSLMKKGAVQYLDTSKYEDKGVYSIVPEYHGLVADAPAKEATMEEEVIIIKNESQLKELQNKYYTQLKSGQLIGLKGFDKNYYLVSQTAVARVGSKVVAALKDANHSLSKVSELVEEPPELVKAVLEVLKESGDVLEKRREVYALA